MVNATAQYVATCYKREKVIIICDVFKGYRGIPLGKASQKVLSNMTYNGVYTPTRIPQGPVDSVMHFQWAMNFIFAERKRKHMLAWIDDIIEAARTMEYWF